MKRTLLILIPLLATILALEFGLRLKVNLKTYSEQNFDLYQSAYSATNLEHLYVWAKNDSIYSQQKEFRFSYLTNDQGLIDQHLLDTCTSKNSIIYLGDSFTFGVGSSQDSNLPACLEKQLPLNIINAGIPGSDPFFETLVLDSFFIDKGFHKAIFMVNLSDIYDFVIRGGNERFIPNNKVKFRAAPWIETPYKYSYVFRAFVHKIMHLDFSLQAPSKMKGLKQEAIVAYTDLFLSINKNVDFVVVLQPYARQYASNNEVLSEVLNYTYLEKLDSSFRANNIKTINLDPSLKNIMGPDNYLDYSWDLDGHYNNKGYELLATLLALKLEEKYPNFIQTEEKQ